MRMRRKKNLIPRMERCERLLVPDPYAMPGKWREEFPGARGLYLELGCGKGRFTAQTAEANPDSLLIGLEVVPDAIVVAMERCMELSNVLSACQRQSAPLFFRARRSRSHLSELLRSLAQQAPRETPSDAWKFSPPLSADSQTRRTDSYEDRQRTPV